MGTRYVSSVYYAAVASRANNTAYVIGNIVKNTGTTPGNNQERCFRCTTAGTSAGAQPAGMIGTANSITVTDGTVVWTEITGQEAYQSPGNWSAPHAAMNNPWQQGGSGASDYVYVDKAHSEAASGVDWLQGWAGIGPDTPGRVISVDASGSSHVPPLTSDWSKGGIVNCNAEQFYNGSLYNWGMISKAAGNHTFASGTSAHHIFHFENCEFWFTGAGYINCCNSSSYGDIVFDNCKFNFFNTSGGIAFLGVGGPAKMTFKNIADFLVSGSAIPANLYQGSATGNTILGYLEFENCDFTSLGAITFIDFNASTKPLLVKLKNCNLGLMNLSPGGAFQRGLQEIAYEDCGYKHLGEGLTYPKMNGRLTYEGTMATDRYIVLSGGANDGYAPYSWQVITTSKPLWNFPFEFLPLEIDNKTYNSLAQPHTLTLTVYGIVNDSVVPKNDEFWFDMEYYATSTSLMKTKTTTTKANLAASGSSWSADTSSWGNTTTNRTPWVRNNSTAVILGQAIYVASNPGRVFFCTTAGTTAGSEPGGYSSCVDGGTVNDGTAVFRAGCRFKMTTTIPATVSGKLKIFVKAAKASTTYYFDTAPTLTSGLSITGIVYDTFSNVVIGATVKIIRMADWVCENTVTSDGSGNYTSSVQTTGLYAAAAYLPGTTEICGIQINMAGV